jgi:hypothetical protein
MRTTCSLYDSDLKFEVEAAGHQRLGGKNAHHEHLQIVPEAIRRRSAGDRKDGRAHEVRDGQLGRRRQRLQADTSAQLIEVIAAHKGV